MTASVKDSARMMLGTVAGALVDVLGLARL
jgi:hypothetical protein